ncbi:stearoyl-CoA desaturase 5-like [Mercenaria mercenaria]|uniref:stearoyl-CoA desaturase 5-like n=1 Tax=Mercenaria mercenaria TaxID=6596 RepID=UPI00234EBE6C|nr:stearoyl-CoA desaturase 5-like [Mercenaria mercenaria]XP_045213870.2 stearoyl-CoA desaturase 5-like [Mercenaria mercenaria]
MSPRAGFDEKGASFEGDTPVDSLGLAPTISEDPEPETNRPPVQIVWRNVILMTALHIAAVYGLYIVPQAKLATVVWTLILYWLSGIGITAGAHRLWSHRSYKAKLPLRVILALLNSMAFQNDIIEWARDHRVHHKYSETDADPHNAKRGFFFSHIGWLLVRKHPDVKRKGKQLDISDLLADPVLRVQRKFYLPSVVLLCFAIPSMVPVYFWGENLITAFVLCGLLKYCAILNATWFVNSIAHLWGMRPYDVRINPAENRMVATVAMGEGFHNYHHTFPQDYSTAEFKWFLNFSTLFIDIFAFFGLAYDRKTMPKPFIEKRRQRTGDKSALAGRKIK